MNERVKEYLSTYPDDIVDLFHRLRQIVWDCALSEPQETLWARLPSYYVGEAFIRPIPFKDHINIESAAIPGYRDALHGCKITPKGMLQICLKQELPTDVLHHVFSETFA